MGDGATHLRGRYRSGGGGRRTPEQIAEGRRSMRAGEWQMTWGTVGAVALCGGALMSGLGLGVAAVGFLVGAAGGATVGGVSAYCVNQLDRWHEAGAKRAQERADGVTAAALACAPSALAARFDINDPGHTQAFNNRQQGVHATASVAAPAAVPAPPTRN